MGDAQAPVPLICSSDASLIGGAVDKQHAFNLTSQGFCCSRDPGQPQHRRHLGEAQSGEQAKAGAAASGTTGRSPDRPSSFRELLVYLAGGRVDLDLLLIPFFGLILDLVSVVVPLDVFDIGEVGPALDLLEQL